MDIYNAVIILIAVIMAGCYVCRKSTEKPASIEIGSISFKIRVGGRDTLKSYIQVMLPYRIYLVPAVPVIAYIVWAKDRISADTWKKAGIILIAGIVIGVAAAIARLTGIMSDIKRTPETAKKSKTAAWPQKKENIAERKSGSGRKSPVNDILSMRSNERENLIILDPDGTFCDTLGPQFQSLDYNVRYVDLIEIEKSDRYNPLEYVSNPKDAAGISETIVDCTMMKQNETAEQAQLMAEAYMIAAVIAYVKQNIPPEKCNMTSVLDMFRDCDKPAPADGEKWMSLFDYKFAKLEENDPAKILYKNCIRECANNDPKISIKAVMIICVTRLHIFLLKEVQDMTAWDNMLFNDYLPGRNVIFLRTAYKDVEYGYNLLGAILEKQVKEKFGGVRIIKLESQ